MNRIVIKNLINATLEAGIDLKKIGVNWIAIKSHAYSWKDRYDREIDRTLIYNPFGGSENL